MLCEYCEEKPFKYSCPKCSINYCSVECYKLHNEKICSESFYKHQIENEILGDELSFDGSSVNKMNQILERLNIEDEKEAEECLEQGQISDSDDEEVIGEDDLITRIANVNLNDTELLWSKLSEAEKEDFQSIILSGESEKIFTPITPWWYKTVEVFRKDKHMLNKYEKIQEHIKCFSDITKKEPAFNVNYNLCNIIAAYSFVYKYFNGDFEEYTGEAAAVFHLICNVLSKNTIFESKSLAIKSVIEECSARSLDVSEEELNADVNKILEESELNQNFKLIIALGDAKKILKSSTKKNLSKNDNPNSFINIFSIPMDEDGKVFRLYGRKIDFYLSYVKYKFNNSVLKQ